MTTGQLLSHINAALELLDKGDLQLALREAEHATDETWMMGDATVTKALPLLSMLRHATGDRSCVFQDLDDLPKSFATSLLTEANLLAQRHPFEAASLMLEDVNHFVDRWIGRESHFKPSPVDCGNDEKIRTLIGEIERFNLAGERGHAIEASLQLANEFAIRGNRHRAFRTFRQVIRKAKVSGRVAVRMDALIDFGQFLGQIQNYDDALYTLKLAVGVARKSRDRERFAQAIAALGVVTLHAGQVETAWGYLKKAHSMLSPWDLESNIVKEHLEAIKEGRPCDCPEAAHAASLSDANWE